MDARVDRVLGWLLVIALLVMVVMWCLLPPRYSDGRLADDVARRMYDMGYGDGGDE